MTDNPAYADYPQDPNADMIRYNEGLFVGYRGYEHNNVQPLYPFGFGLSYTTFDYSKLSVTPDAVSGNTTVQVSFTVKNTGSRAGMEIAQLYLGQRNPSVIRPVKELKGFAKVSLQPGESKVVTLTLDQRAFAYYSEDIGNFKVVRGNYDVSVGASSQDIRLRGAVRVTAQSTIPTTTGVALQNPDVISPMD